MTITLTALSLIFVVMTAGLGLIVRITRRWTQVEDNLNKIAEKMGDLVRNKDEDHRELSERITRNESRIERHELWHDDHPYLRS